MKEPEIPPMASDKSLYAAHLQGMSNREIAETYGLSQSGVRGRISRYGTKIAGDVGTPRDPFLQDRDMPPDLATALSAHEGLTIRKWGDIYIPPGELLKNEARRRTLTLEGMVYYFLEASTAMIGSLNGGFTIIDGWVVPVVRGT